jgi:prepilin-type N-terminal cleavage/methylation domain-containing protein/prepilin-type processing-associated H-X9-DG protein
MANARQKAATKRLGTGRGFTLIEVMVVVAIISLLVVLVVVAFGRGQTIAESTKCLANQRIILNAWRTYGIDHKGRFPGPDTNLNPDKDWMKSIGDNMGPGNAERETAITEGTLFPYVGDVRTYRSPQDTTTHMRTYSINGFLSSGEGADWWGGPPGYLIDTLSRIRNPGQLITVLPENDHRGHNINGWGIDISGGGVWIDKLATFNPGRINFAYMDGHVSSYAWVGESDQVNYDLEYAFNLPQTNVYFPGPDYEWIYRHVFDGFSMDDP